VTVRILRGDCRDVLRTLPDESVHTVVTSPPYWVNGLDGWTCTIFRREGAGLASEMILDAELAFDAFGYGCGPDGLITYVADDKVESPNPGYCFKCAGYQVAGRSADGKKTLLRKPFDLRGVFALERRAA